MQRIGRDKVYVAAYLYEELLAKYDEATLGRTQRAQYGEGETKFYADKHGSKTVNTFKLDYDQREEVNRLAEEAQIDLDAVLFKLVYERDELRTALRVLVAQVEAEDWEAHRVANGYAED